MKEISIGEVSEMFGAATAATIGQEQTFATQVGWAGILLMRFERASR